MAVAGLALVASSACGVNDAANERRGRGDAGVGSIDDTPKDVIQFPDRFVNVAYACDGHGHRVFVTTQSEHRKEMAVVNDESCG